VKGYRVPASKPPTLFLLNPKKGNSRLFCVNHQKKKVENRSTRLLVISASLNRRLTSDSSSSLRISAMNRKELLRLLVNQAQFNGFQFRRWFQAHVHSNWPGTEPAIALLAKEGRHYTLLFSHDFARCFWRGGAHMIFLVPSITYDKVPAQGEAAQATRKPFTRRTIKPGVWKYHLRQMAVAEDPIEYLCRFLPATVQINLQPPEPQQTAAQAAAGLQLV
jgi:hypothetical protein